MSFVETGVISCLIHHIEDSFIIGLDVAKSGGGAQKPSSLIEVYAYENARLGLYE